MSANPLTPHLPRPRLLPGQPVYVNTHAAAWMPGTVVSVAHQAVGIDLATSQGPLRRRVRPWLVVPVAALRRVGEIRAGDQIAASDGTPRTVTAAHRPDGGGWWVLTFDDGQSTAVPEGTLLRLAAGLRAVTLGGARLTSPRHPRP
jgi:hypothetical protein